MDFKTKAAENAILLVGEELGLNFNEAAAFLGVARWTLFRYRKYEYHPFASNSDDTGKTSHYHPALVRDLR